ncbi:hypothetical protein [Synechococcus sp. M16CYN]|uniref:hypothetical protein n=1 Tax=Synechococcus sp. M16CYN TaxID=3103139 RepID=UPI00333F0339
MDRTVAHGNPSLYYEQTRLVISGRQLRDHRLKVPPINIKSNYYFHPYFKDVGWTEKKIFKID